MMATTPVCGEGSLGCLRCGGNESVVGMKMNTYFIIIFYYLFCFFIVNKYYIDTVVQIHIINFSIFDCTYS
jgi:hypothetical protein